MPRHEATILSLRSHALEEADQILELAQQRFRQASPEPEVLV